MARNSRNWHPDFVKYMDFIINHPNYSGLPEPRTEDGKPKWVVPGNSILGRKRGMWWTNKVQEMGLNSPADVARAIHPKELRGFKPCQICGKKLSIFYVYPNKNTRKKLENLTELIFEPYEETVDEIFERLKSEGSLDQFRIFRYVFQIPSSVKESEVEYLEYIKTNRASRLSPGAMSNPPDRFDGFHTYNACCRHEQDTGRHIVNLQRYTQDRRAYENWADGNWNLSNRLMGEFNRFPDLLKCPSCGRISKMTADHIGPISLGFTHRPRFNPLCKRCNSRKNNRMTLDDVNTLLREDLGGEQIVSWHSKYIWDKLKNEVYSEEDALKLSKVMRQNLHSVLTILSLVKSHGGENFLKENILHPEYSFYDYRFENFHPFRLDEIKIVRVPLTSKNKEKNADRYIRIALESLDEYQEKDNRRTQIVRTLDGENVRDFLEGLETESYDHSLKKLKSVVEDVSEALAESFLLDS